MKLLRHHQSLLTWSGVCPAVTNCYCYCRLKMQGGGGGTAHKGNSIAGIFDGMPGPQGHSSGIGEARYGALRSLIFSRNGSELLISLAPRLISISMMFSSAAIGQWPKIRLVHLLFSDPTTRRSLSHLRTLTLRTNEATGPVIFLEITNVKPAAHLGDPRKWLLQSRHAIPSIPHSGIPPQMSSSAQIWL